MIHLNNHNHSVRLIIIGLENRDTNAYNKPLLSTKIEITTPDVWTEYMTYIRTDEIQRFHEEIIHLEESVNEPIKLITMETGIQIEAYRNDEGLIHWSVETMNPDSEGSTYVFAFDADDTALIPLKSSIESVLITYDHTKKTRD